MTIDWSKAPAHATHWCPGNAVIAEGWIYNVGGEFYSCYADSGLEHIPEFPEWRKGRLIPRPTQQPWTGDGMPPVGTVCEFKSVGHHSDPEYQWCIYHGKMSCGGYIIEYHHYTSPSMTTCAPFDPALTSFRPIKTSDQIAAEEKGRAVNDMLGIVCDPALKGRGLSNQLEALYDAGYRKQVTE